MSRTSNCPVSRLYNCLRRSTARIRMDTACTGACCSLRRSRPRILVDQCTCCPSTSPCQGCMSNNSSHQCKLRSSRGIWHSFHLYNTFHQNTRRIVQGLAQSYFGNSSRRVIHFPVDRMMCLPGSICISQATLRSCHPHMCCLESSMRLP